jgi:hypothetical protein
VPRRISERESKYYCGDLFMKGRMTVEMWHSLFGKSAKKKKEDIRKI